MPAEATAVEEVPPMKEYVPLLQTLVWPLFLVPVVWWLRKPLIDVLQAIRSRIEAGASFEAGTSGVKLGPSSREGRTDATPATALEGAPEAEPSDREADEACETPKRGPTISGQPENPGIYLVHESRRARSLDRGKTQYYHIRLFLETDPGVELGSVSQVEYHLHPTVPPPDGPLEDPETQFEYEFDAWGQFNATADVYLEGSAEPLRLERYLNF
jgi:hypothetical protein